MIKKGLIKSLIRQYIDDNKLEKPEQVFEHAENIYNMLKNNTDVQLPNVSFDVFRKSMKEGFILSSMQARNSFMN